MAHKPSATGSRNNLVNPYLKPDTFRRLNELRWRRRAAKWGDLFDWAMPILEKKQAQIEAAARRAAKRARLARGPKRGSAKSKTSRAR